MKKVLLLFATIFSVLTLSAQTNLLENGDFETWESDNLPVNWKSASTASNATLTKTTAAHGGTYAVELTKAAKNMRLAYKELDLEAGTYEISFYAKCADAESSTVVKAGYVPVNADNKVGTYVYGDEVNAAADWTKVSYSFKLAAASRVCVVVMVSKNSLANAVVDDASLVLTEKGEEPSEDTYEKMTVAEALAAEVGVKAQVDGSVMAQNSNSIVLGDETGYMFCFKPVWLPEVLLSVGDKVSVQGEISTYGGFNQFNSPMLNILGSGTVSYPTPTVMTGADLDGWVAEPEIDYIKFRGTLNISGNYYNVSVEGAETAVGSIVSPSAELKEQLSNGSEYDITGFALYVSSKKYVNVVVTDVKLVQEVELTDISNTPATAYSVARAHELIEDPKSDLSKKVYVKGLISKIQSIAGNYTNAIYFISDDATEEGQLEVYQGYGIGGEDITSDDYFKIGDEVVVYGELYNYNGTHEMNKGNYIYSLNGSTEQKTGIETVLGDAAQPAAIFDIAGRRVVRASQGLYIVNGKKVLF